MTDTTVEYGKCPECGYLMLPVLPLSPCGHEAEPTLEPLADVGTVYSWSKAGTGEQRLMAMVDFFDGALRVTAPITAESVAIGDRALVVTGVDTPYEFRLVEDASRLT